MQPKKNCLCLRQHTSKQTSPTHRVIFPATVTGNDAFSPPDFLSGLRGVISCDAEVVGKLRLAVLSDPPETCGKMRRGEMIGVLTTLANAPHVSMKRMFQCNPEVTITKHYWHAKTCGNCERTRLISYFCNQQISTCVGIQVHQRLKLRYACIPIDLQLQSVRFWKRTLSPLHLGLALLLHLAREKQWWRTLKIHLFSRTLKQGTTQSCQANVGSWTEVSADTKDWIERYLNTMTKHLCSSRRNLFKLLHHAKPSSPVCLKRELSLLFHKRNQSWHSSKHDCNCSLGKCNVVTSVLWCHEFQTCMGCHVTIYGHITPSTKHALSRNKAVCV